MTGDLSYEIKIVRLFATCELDSEVDLGKLAENTEEVTYYPEAMPMCAYLKKDDNEDMHGTVVVWNSGKLHLIEHSKEDVESDLEYAMRMLEKTNAIEE